MMTTRDYLAQYLIDYSGCCTKPINTEQLDKFEAEYDQFLEEASSLCDGDSVSDLFEYWCTRDDITESFYVASRMGLGIGFWDGWKHGDKLHKLALRAGRVECLWDNGNELVMF